MSSTTSPSQRILESRTHLCGAVTVDDVGQRIKVCGWVAKRREHGEHLAFVDLRDFSGIVQCVVEGTVDVRSEYVLQVEGTVQLRPEGTSNDALSTGMVELHDCTVTVLNIAEPPPFSLDERAEVDEPARLRHRFVDLRRTRMQDNLRMRAAVNRAIRHAMDAQGFCEIETPMLWAPTPEGSREFAVPSRQHQGRFYVLPQSPQLAKQLLMVSGFDRYYQIARCLRDEDLRADRQFEFTQLDLECSFATEAEIRSFVTEAVLDAAQAVLGERPEYPVTMTWAEALDRFGTDKPDLRFSMELLELSEVFAHTEVKAFSAPTVKALLVEGGGAMSRSALDKLVDRAKELGAKGLAWFKISDGGAGLELESPLAKVLTDAERQGLFEVTGARAGDLIVVVADQYRLACNVLGQLRVELGGKPVSEGPYRYCWIIDFPLFDGTDAEGNPEAAHHAFTMPHPEDLHLLATEPLKVRAQSYDLVLNGWELGSGSIRIHRADIQRQVFAAMGIAEEEGTARFGFLLNAFRYGAPPHGGFAFGIDRLVAIFAGENNIREVIAFPKTQSGADLLTGAPGELSPQHMAELGLRPVPKAT